jgi:hypothetical protein
MKIEELFLNLKSYLTTGVHLESYEKGITIHLPFNDYKGESIEIGLVQNKDGTITINDLGYVSGALFELGEHSQESMSHILTRKLMDSYKFSIDYNEGVLSETISTEHEIDKMFDFLKIVISLDTLLPFIAQPRKKFERKKRLSAQISREIKQLRFPLSVEKYAQVQGKYEQWDIDYSYLRREDQANILILTADLSLKEPKERAAHIITLAGDVLDKEIREKSPRELRVVYSANGDKNNAMDRAINIIEDYKGKIGYLTFNYADRESKSNFTNITIHDLSPLSLS